MTIFLHKRMGESKKQYSLHKKISLVQLYFVFLQSNIKMVKT